MRKSLRRRIGRAPNYARSIWRAAIKNGAEEIRKMEDELWMDMIRKEFNISPTLMKEPTGPTTVVEMQMMQAASKYPKEIKLSAKVFL